jgi:hypothetical protein
MPNRTIYLPPDLAAAVDEFDGELNVSAICQDALRAAIEAQTQRCSRCGNHLDEQMEERGGGDGAD